MYPDRELIRLAAHRAGLQQTIGNLRVQIAADASRVVHPVAVVDRVVAFWRQLSPLTKLAAVPLGILIARSVFPHLKFLRRLFSWGPIVMSTARIVGSAVKSGLRATSASARD